MSSIKRINHVAIVVKDIDYALRFWEDALGLKVTHVENIPEQDALVAFLSTGEAEIELVKPMDKDSSVAHYLSKRGPGIHHICFEVDDIEACLDKLRAHDVHLINPEPVVGTGGKRVAFIHPESTHGVLIELYELTEQEPEIRLSRVRALADRAIFEGQVATASVLKFLRGIRYRATSEERSTPTSEES